MKGHAEADGHWSHGQDHLSGIKCADGCSGSGPGRWPQTTNMESWECSSGAFPAGSPCPRNGSRELWEALCLLGAGRLVVAGGWARGCTALMNSYAEESTSAQLTCGMHVEA